MIIKAPNNLTEEAPKTYLASNMASGTVQVPWRNANGFAASWGIQLGDTGEDTAEVLILGAGTPVNAYGTTTANSAFSHATDTPVYAIKYNKVIFKCSTSGTAGTATAITNGTVTIQPDQDFTQYDHTAGSASYAYKTCWYNSVLDVSSADSDWMTSSGNPLYSLVGIRDRVKDKLPKEINSYVTDDQIDSWTNEWLETMTNTAIDVNEDYSLGTTSVAFSGTAQEGTITSSDFKSVRRAYYTEDGTNIYMMTKQELTGFQPGETFNATHPYYYMKGETVIGRNPHDASGTITLDYYKLNAVLNDDGDCLPQTMRGYSNSFVKWGLAQALRKDNRTQEAVQLEQQAEQDRERFKKEMQPRNKSGPTYIDIVEDVGDSDNDYFW